MAKKKKNSKGSFILAPLLRGLSWVWRLISKILGNSIRFIFRSSKELDPAHQRDGIAFFVFILALIAIAGTWFKLDNLLGRSIHSFLLGGVGRLAYLVPVIFVYFAYRLFKSPDESNELGRITIGTLLLLTSATALMHIINGSTGTGATAMRQGGGWIAMESLPD